MEQKWIRRSIIAVGSIAIVWAVLDLLALLAFISALLSEPESVPIFGTNFRAISRAVSSLPGLVAIALLSVSIGGLYVKQEAVRRHIYEALNAVVESFAPFFSPEEAVTGCLFYQDVRWIGNYYPDGRVEIDHRECPACALELTETHLPAPVVDNQDTDRTQLTDGGMLFTGIVRDVQRDFIPDEDENFVDALACPQCSFSIRGEKKNSQGNEEVIALFQKHIDQMDDGGDTSFERWEYRAHERVDMDPTPGDLWDEYVLTQSAAELKYVNISEVDEDIEPAPHGTYPALHHLRQQASNIDRVIEYAPEPFDIALNRLTGSEYLEERNKLRERRQETANELTRRLSSLRKKMGTDLEYAFLAKEGGREPDQTLEHVLETAREAENRLKTIQADLPANLLTTSENRRLSQVIRKVETTTHYLAETLRYREEWEEINTKIETFDNRYAPYAEEDQYMVTTDRNMLERIIEQLLGDLNAVIRDLDLRYIPESGKDRLFEARDRFRDLDEIIPLYNDAVPEKDGFAGFVIQQQEAYADLLQTQYGPLNESQQKAVIRDDRFNLVDASAGTGKTLTLTYRVLYLYERGVPIDDIVAMTFTREAADEMKQRISAELPGVDESELNVQTIHAVARGITLDSMLEPVDDDWGPKYYTTKYVNGFVKGADWVQETYTELYEVYQEQYDHFTTVGESYIKNERRDNESTDDLICRKLTEFLERARSFSLTPDEIRSRDDIGPEKQVSYRFSLLGAAVLEAYYDVVDDPDDAADFADFIDTATTLIDGAEELYKTDYRHILVDEFQDVSSREIEFIETLRSASSAHLFCVGDDWQSIYGFRGSNLQHFTEFEQTHHSVTKTTLDINYRCPPAVVDGGAALIKQSEVNQNQKNVRAAKDLDVRPEVHTLSGELYSLRVPLVTADLVEHAHADGYDWNEIMLVSRNDENGQYLNAVRDELNSRSIPHTGPGGASGQSSNQGTTNAVITQSIHKSKGTEAPVVILVHASDDMLDGLPAGERIDEALRGAIDSNVDYYAEERRLFYVAMTRTEERFHAVTKSGRISRYIQDIQDDYFDRIDHDLPALTGDVTSINRHNKHYRGTFNCDAFDRSLRFAILDWKFKNQDHDADQLAARLRGATRIRLMNVEDAFWNQYDQHILLTGKTIVEDDNRTEGKQSTAN